MVIVVYNDKTLKTVYGLWQWDYGQVLRIQGLNLPSTVEIHFSLQERGSDSVTRIGITKDGVTDVLIPDSMLENEGSLQDYNIYAYIYITDDTSGQTEYKITLSVKSRPKPEAFEKPEDVELFREAIKAVNDAAQRAEVSEDNAKSYAEQASEDAAQTGKDREAVKEMVDMVSDIDKQVEAVKEYSQRAERAASEADSIANNAEQFKIAAERASTEANDVSVTVKEVAAKVAEDRVAVATVKEDVDKVVHDFSDVVQQAFDGVNTAGKTQTERVQEEGNKQINVVEQKGKEVLESIPKDFQTQMEIKLDKQQGSENAGKALVVGEDGTVTVENMTIPSKTSDLVNDTSFVSGNNLSLGIANDGLLYIFVSGKQIGTGINIGSSVTPPNRTAVFDADFSGKTPDSKQFYTGNGRIYDQSIYDSLENIECSNNEVKLTSTYDDLNGRWIKQMMCTAGLFESDDFVCEFEAKYSGKSGSWNNVITYGTGIYWTNGLYSDGIKWPAGGEIDAFEQAGGYSETPINFKTPTVHYGTGTGSGYPDTHIAIAGKTVEFEPDQWHKFKFSLKNGVVQTWIDDVLAGENDFSNCVVSNNYLADYKPFLKPQAFYIDGSCASSSDKSNIYEMFVKNFKVYQSKKVECTGLKIYPQMWEDTTELTFPIGAEIFLEKEYIPVNTSNKACVWKSSDPTVATVVQGYVKTLKAGTTTITAKCDNATAQYIINVSEISNVPCAKIVAANESLTIIQNDTVKCNINIYPKFTTDIIKWISSKPEIASVDNGIITGISVGNCTITASCGTKSVTINVNIIEGSKPAIAYDMSNAIERIESRYADWNNNKTSEDFIIPNTGSLSNGNTILKIGNSSDNMMLSLKPFADAIIQPESMWVWITEVTEVIKNNAILKLNDKSAINNMPTIFVKSGLLEVYYGHVDTYKFADNPCIIAIGHDNSGYYLWANGEIVKTYGSANEIGYLKYISGLYIGSLMMKTDELKNNFISLLNTKQAVYLSDRSFIQTIVDRDFRR